MLLAVGATALYEYDLRERSPRKRGLSAAT